MSLSFGGFFASMSASTISERTENASVETGRQGYHLSGWSYEPLNRKAPISHGIQMASPTVMTPHRQPTTETHTFTSSADRRRRHVSPTAEMEELVACVTQSAKKRARQVERRPDRTRLLAAPGNLDLWYSNLSSGLDVRVPFAMVL